MITNRTLLSGEAKLLRNMLILLSDYHNSVAEYRDVRYPLNDIDQTISAIDDGIKTGKCMANVCFDDSAPIAFCSIEMDKKRSCGELKYLFVRESHRNNGLGNLLMEWALCEFEKAGIGLVDIRVVLGNPAFSFYERYGFKPRIAVISRKGQDRA